MLAYTSTQRQLSRRWGHFGVFTALFAFLNAIFNFLRVWHFFPTALAAVACEGLVDGLLLPVWGVWLGAQLVKVPGQGGTYSAFNSPSEDHVQTTKNGSTGGEVQLAEESTRAPGDDDGGAGSSTILPTPEALRDPDGALPAAEAVTV